jgi:pimeloyl-ACP methyl ester carboxylesterase
MVLVMRRPDAASVAQRHLMDGEGALPTGASRIEGRPDIPAGRSRWNPSLRSAALFLAVLPLLAVSAAAEPVVAGLEPVETCFVAPPEDIAADTGAYECGYVVVPENHAEPGDRMVRLGYVRLPARSGVSKAPFFMMAGGPGSSLLQPDTFRLLGNGFLGALRDDRDIVILEQRGALNSIPALTCPSTGPETWLVVRFGLDRAEAAELGRQSFRDCVDQARAHGIDLAQYNSLAIAADVNLAREALGYERIVYYGASYGAQLGQHVMRDYPGILEAVILDGASALSVKSWVEYRVVDVDEGVEHLVATCEADRKCDEAYDIRALIDEAMGLFDEGPITTAFTDPADPGTSIPLTFDEHELAAQIFELQTGQIFIRSLPAFLDSMVADGRESMAQVFGAVLGQEVLAARNAGPGEMATLSHAAVVCSDDPVTSPDDMILPEGASRYARVFGQQILDQYMALCETVDVPTLPDDTDIDPVADVPTLVLSGWLDVRTPTGRSLEVAKALPNALLVTFWQGSHVQLGEVNLCAAQIVEDFVADPAAEIDLSCVEEFPALGFVLPDGTISVD